MKKTVLFVAILMVFCVAGSFAVTGIGLQGGYKVADDLANVGLTFSTGRYVMGLDAGIGQDDWTVGFTADRWMANPVVSKPVCWYWALGLAANYQSLNAASVTDVFVGLRLVTGFNMFLGKERNLELYVQGAYQPGIQIYIKNPAEEKTVGFDYLSFPVNAGFRYWF